MSYIFNQYNHPEEADSGFLTLVTSGEATRRNSLNDSEVMSGDFGMNFADECVKITSGLQKDVSYYFHGKIHRMSTEQTIDIKLVNFSSENGEDEQYIKTINIRKSEEINNQWVDVDFIFTPAADFDTILFELRRIRDDYSESQQRFPIIIYEELSVINNILPSHLEDAPVELLKIGVQARSGLMMCINSEQILVGKTGIYELRNGVIKTTMFSVVAPAEEDGLDMSNLQKNLANRGADPTTTTSVCLFDKPKTRIIDAFTLDYMYERED